MAMINDNNKKSEMDKVIDAHWEYNKGLLEKSLLIGRESGSYKTNKILELCEYCYRTAWVHGAKHALEKNDDSHKCFGHYMDNCEKYPCPYIIKCKEVTKEGL